MLIAQENLCAVAKRRMLAVRLIEKVFIATISCVLLAGYCVGQGQPNARATDSATSVQKGISLAERGRCQEALPIFKQGLLRVSDVKLRYKAAILNAQCALGMGKASATLEALGLLNREFPNDPQVLYITTHFCSELAGSAARELADNAPTSYQAQELEAEAFESNAKWDMAADVYRKVLEQYPGLPGIHYRLGRIILSRPATATTTEDARKEFEAELQIDPTSAPAEFMLGDLARQLQQWDQAIIHFSKVAKLDAGFSEAYLGLGMALNAAGKHSDAIPPLESYTKSQPDDPAGHYQLAMAYARTGRKDDAAKELGRQRELDQKVNRDSKR